MLTSPWRRRLPDRNIGHSVHGPTPDTAHRLRYREGLPRGGNVNLCLPLLSPQIQDIQTHRQELHGKHRKLGNIGAVWEMEGERKKGIKRIRQEGVEKEEEERKEMEGKRKNRG